MLSLGQNFNDDTKASKKTPCRMNKISISYQETNPSNSV